MTRLHGRDAEITERRESNSGDTTLVSEPPHDYIPEYCNDADGAQAQKVWNELYLLRQQGSLGQQAPQYGQDHSNPYAALQSHPSNYLEDIAARYRKSQEDEISLRHAEDLAAGRVEPSGEGGFHPPPGPSDPSNTTVFVGGLHHNVTEPELFKFFQPFGQISYVRDIATNRI